MKIKEVILKKIIRGYAVHISSTNDTLMSSRGGMLSSKLTKYNIFHQNYTETSFNYFDNFKKYGRKDKTYI